MATSSTTQEFVPVQEIRDGVAVLKNGEMRLVILVSSINFDLKNEDEQTAILLQFQNFLNSLDFSVQIFVQSRKLDIRPYLALLEDRVKEQTNELLKIQTQEYIQFVKTFSESTNIMTKTFFVVVPYAPALLGRTSRAGSLSSLFSTKKKGGAEELEVFEENRSQLEQRREVVTSGLARAGLRSIQLGTEELVELYYKLFNPGELGKPLPPEVNR